MMGFKVMTRRDIVLRASNKALEVRRLAKIGLWDAFCVYDLADLMGVEVRFVDIPSMEGMYFKGQEPTIFISSLRPQGRQVFTCAHELGHHVYQHGGRIDEIVNHPLIENRRDPEEYLADRFASFLLMPKSSVSRAFYSRGWKDIDNCSPVQIFTVAGWFGVGYETLIYHMELSLNILSKRPAEKLLRVTPKQLKTQIVGSEISENLIIVDTFWTARAIDIQVGDIVLLPNGTSLEGRCVSLLTNEEKGIFFYGLQPGIGRFENKDANWSIFIRVSRKGYVGRNIFRHLEEPDDEE